MIPLRKDAEIIIGIIVEQIAHDNSNITTSSTATIIPTPICIAIIITFTNETTMDINIIANSILTKATIILRLIMQTSDLGLVITQIKINTRMVVEIWAVVQQVSDNNLKTMVGTDITFTRREGDLC